MIRVVVDTNVFVSSFFGGNPRRIIDLWRTGRILLCLSRPVVDEYVDVLHRLGLQNQRQIEELLHLFAQAPNILYSAATPVISVVDADPSDNKFIECAVALRCKYIVSGDKHLLAVKKYMAIHIISPKDFLDIINNQHPG